MRGGRCDFEEPDDEEPSDVELGGEDLNGRAESEVFGRVEVEYHPVAPAALYRVTSIQVTDATSKRMKAGSASTQMHRFIQRGPLGKC